MANTLPNQLTDALNDLALTPAHAARRVGGDAGYTAAHKRMQRYLSDDPPTSIRLLLKDLDALGLEIKIVEK